MKTILNSFRIRLDTFQLTYAAITRDVAHSLTTVKTVLAAKFDPRKEDGLEDCPLPFGILVTSSGAEIPVEVAWSDDEKGFEVAIKLVRKCVRFR
jgi:hypothetical protein